MKCTKCSKGCNLILTTDENNKRLYVGGLCSRGNETEPFEKETLTDIYKVYLPVKNGYMKNMLAVSDVPINRDLFEVLDAVFQNMVLEAPIYKNQIILKNPLGCSFSIVAARGLKERK